MFAVIISDIILDSRSPKTSFADFILITCTNIVSGEGDKSKKLNQEMIYILLRIFIFIGRTN